MVVGYFIKKMLILLLLEPIVTAPPSTVIIQSSTVTVQPSISTMQSYTVIVQSSAVTVQPSSTPDFKEQNKDSTPAENSNVGAIAGGVAVGVFVPVVIVVAVSAVVLWIKSRRSTQVHSKGTSNPVYDTNSKLCTPCLCVRENVYILSISSKDNRQRCRYTNISDIC